MKLTTLFIFTLLSLLAGCNNENTGIDNSIKAASSDSASLAKEEKDGFPVDTVTAGKYPSPGEFHKMLARSNGVWTGEGTMQFGPDAPLVDAGKSVLVNSMVLGGLYQVSEIKGSPAAGMGAPWTGVRITGYDAERKVFTRAMIGDGASTGGVGMEGTWDQATKSITMPFSRTDPATGKAYNLKEVYKIIDENTEVLEIYGMDPKTKKEFKMLNVKWTRKK